MQATEACRYFILDFELVAALSIKMFTRKNIIESPLCNCRRGDIENSFLDAIYIEIIDRCLFK